MENMNTWSRYIVQVIDETSKIRYFKEYQLDFPIDMTKNCLVELQLNVL